MPIKEESFRIGSGRYIQGKGYIYKLVEEILRLGKTPLIIGGQTALEKTKGKIKMAIESKIMKYDIVTYKGTCHKESAMRLAQYAQEEGYDVIVGIGGGVICDFAKLCASHAKLPILNVPTSSATCAAYTPLSVCYSEEGRTVGSVHYSYEVDCVIVDTEILIEQPVRLFVAGVFDALAKFVEIKQRYVEGKEDFPLGLDHAYIMSKYSFNYLTGKVQKCIDDMQSGIISDDFERVVFPTIATTGVISGIARGSNQTAIAHKFYEAIRFLFPEQTKRFTHGELVGVGMLIQNHFNGEEENNAIILKLMKEHNIPSCIEEMNIEKNHEVFDLLYSKICSSSAIESEEDAKKLKESMNYFWNL